MEGHKKEIILRFILSRSFCSSAFFSRVRAKEFERAREKEREKRRANLERKER